MLTTGDRVEAIRDGALGIVASVDASTVMVQFDDGTAEHFRQPANEVQRVKSAPGPSESTDPQHAQALKYARQAGILESTLAEVQHSLEMIREYDLIKTDAGVQFELGFCARLIASALRRTQEL